MTKVYTRRDSALKALRKAGIDKENQDDYLKKVAAGFEVILPDKKETKKKAPVKAKVKTKAKAKTPAKKKPVDKKDSSSKTTVASRIRGLIKEGKNNKEVWEIVQPEFDLSDNKKHYPGWYRSQMNRAEA